MVCTLEIFTDKNGVGAQKFDKSGVTV